LRATYANARTALKYGTDFQLLVAVMLSAQCTDARVNMVTPGLFRAHPDAASMAALQPEELEPLIMTCGLYKSKAKNIVATSRLLVARHESRVPATMEELIELPGVGRKTANVVLSVAFDKAAIAVDTHVFRVANRLGLTKARNPVQAEMQLMKVIPEAEWSDAHHWLIHHGREICHARRPECARCPLRELCPSAKKFLSAERAARSPASPRSPRKPR
jgi:endonuclease-3